MAFSGIVLPFPDHGDYGDHARLRRFAPLYYPCMISPHSGDILWKSFFGCPDQNEKCHRSRWLDVFGFGLGLANC